MTTTPAGQRSPKAVVRTLRSFLNENLGEKRVGLFGSGSWGRRPWCLSTLGLQAVRCGGREVEMGGGKQEENEKAGKRGKTQEHNLESPLLSGEACSLTQHSRKAAWINGLDFFALTNQDIPESFLQVDPWVFCEGNISFPQTCSEKLSELLVWGSLCR